MTKVLDYSLGRWIALTQYLEDGAVPIDDNTVENQIKLWAHGRSKLVVRRVTAQRQAGSRDHELDPVSTGSVCLSQKCADAPPNAAGQ
jgi:hypothetical protein